MGSIKWESELLNPILLRCSPLTASIACIQCPGGLYKHDLTYIMSDRFVLNPSGNDTHLAL